VSGLNIDKIRESPTRKLTPTSRKNLVGGLFPGPLNEIIYDTNGGLAISVGIENIYDAHVADEKLKTGTKYERLAAIWNTVFVLSAIRE